MRGLILAGRLGAIAAAVLALAAPGAAWSQTVTSVTEVSYDAALRPLCTAVRMNPATFGNAPGDACTLGAAGPSGPDRITRQVYDAAGQVVKVQKAYGTPLQQDYATYTWSGDGKQTSLTDANGNLATMAYDGFDRQVSWTFPSATSAGQVNPNDYEAYGYDANGNRVSLRKRDGRTIAYAYDALNRLTAKTYPNGGARPVYYGYDLQGHQTAAQFDGTGDEGIATRYTVFGDVASTTSTMGGVGRALGYLYDSAGNRARITHPDGQFVDCQYDGSNRPWNCTNAQGTSIIVIAYSALGPPGYIYRGVGGSNIGRDALGRLTQLVDQSVVNGGVISTSTYSYNPANQLTSLTRSNDAFAFTGQVNVDRSYAANGLNQYTSAGPAAFSYDANGNLTGDGTNTYAYDIENRLVSSSTGATLAYDPQGRLWQTAGGAGGTTRFLYDGDRLTAEYDGAGAMLKRYVHGADDDNPLVWYDGPGIASPRFLYADHQGSIVAVTDAGGTVTVINTYDEYGIPGAGNAGRFQYTGQAWIPELGMYYYKARMYSPSLGRFMQTDPIGYKDQNNLYAYVANDSVNGRDPTGTQLSRIPEDLGELWKDFKKAPVATVLDVLGGLEPNPISSIAVEASAARSVGRAEGSEATTMVSVSRSAHPEAAAHIERAQAAGQPRTLTVDRAGAASRRREALRDTPTRSGVDRDEYPPAMFKEGGKGSSVDHINPSDNRGAGASISHQCRNVSNGGRVTTTVCD